MILLRRHPLVKSDIEEAAYYYETKRAGLGTDFVEEVERGLFSNHPSGMRTKILVAAFSHGVGNPRCKRSGAGKNAFARPAK
jgi:hypothetical protein